MRYRKVGYSYSMVVSTGESQNFGYAWNQGQARMGMSRTCWRPPSDVYETEDAFVATIELAGIDESETDVFFYDNAIVVEGRRKMPPVEAKGVYRAVEIRQGPFRVELALPAPIDSEKVSAQYERGLLRMTLPKAKRGEHNG